MANLSTNVPIRQAPFLAPGGQISQPWMQFLLQLWGRTGGAQGVDSDQLQQIINEIINGGVIGSGDSDSSVSVAYDGAIVSDIAASRETQVHGFHNDPLMHEVATSARAGFMAASDKAALDLLSSSIISTHVGTFLQTHAGDFITIRS